MDIMAYFQRYHAVHPASARVGSYLVALQWPKPACSSSKSLGIAFIKYLHKQDRDIDGMIDEHNDHKSRAIA